jgi:hypothetical protein
MKGDSMPIVSEAVENAKVDIDHLGPDIEEWTKDFVELFANVTNLDLIFQETEKMDLNYVALCNWDDPSNLVIIRSLPTTQTGEERKKTLATASILTALLNRLEYHDVAVALLGDSGGRMFRHEGFAGRCQSINGCSRVAEFTSPFDSIVGHVSVNRSSVGLN